MPGCDRSGFHNTVIKEASVSSEFLLFDIFIGTGEASPQPVCLYIGIRIIDTEIGNVGKTCIRRVTYGHFIAVFSEKNRHHTQGFIDLICYGDIRPCIDRMRIVLITAKYCRHSEYCGSAKRNSIGIPYKSVELFM